MERYFDGGGVMYIMSMDTENYFLYREIIGVNIVIKRLIKSKSKQPRFVMVNVSRQFQ